MSEKFTVAGYIMGETKAIRDGGRTFTFNNLPGAKMFCSSQNNHAKGKVMFKIFEGDENSVPESFVYGEETIV